MLNTMHTECLIQCTPLISCYLLLCTILMWLMALQALHLVFYCVHFSQAFPIELGKPCSSCDNTENIVNSDLKLRSLTHSPKLTLPKLLLLPSFRLFCFPVKGAMFMAEMVSCLKRTLARMLVIIVSLGFGIVK